MRAADLKPKHKVEIPWLHRRMNIECVLVTHVQTEERPTGTFVRVHGLTQPSRYPVNYVFAAAEEVIVR